jgi:hypothetical protein
MLDSHRTSAVRLTQDKEVQRCRGAHGMSRDLIDFSLCYLCKVSLPHSRSQDSCRHTNPVKTARVQAVLLHQTHLPQSKPYAERSQQRSTNTTSGTFCLNAISPLISLRGRTHTIGCAHSPFAVRDVSAVQNAAAALGGS